MPVPMQFYQLEVTRTLLMMNDYNEKNRCVVEGEEAQLWSEI
jgi:hypothetical protein